MTTIFSQRIIQLRSSHDPPLTQEEFGEMVGLSRNAIIDYETGKAKPRRAKLEHIARVFKVDTKWLTGNAEGVIKTPAPVALHVSSNQLNGDYVSRELYESEKDRRARAEQRADELQDILNRLYSKQPGSLEQPGKRYPVPMMHAHAGGLRKAA